MNNILMFVMFMILFGFGSNSGGKAQYRMISVWPFQIKKQRDISVCKYLSQKPKTISK